ncbi:MAG: ATP-binding protein [Sandaracinaceae bacterium]|nr:ATP-binding protein [Sandaracinaceae bacterium]
MSDPKTTHRFEAEVEQVLRLVIESLYSNREIFLRELVSNAADALDKLRFRALTEPGLVPEGTELAIRLLPDRDAGTLTVSDNGVGMTREELIENLGTIAKSGTRELVQKLKESKSADLSLIGQFGVGFYSAFLVADEVAVVSRAAGASEAHRWVSDGRGGFSVEPAEREGQGTSVVLQLSEEHREYLDPVRLRQLVERYSDYLSWSIELKTARKEGDSYVEGFGEDQRGQRALAAAEERGHGGAVPRPLSSPHGRLGEAALVAALQGRGRAGVRGHRLRAEPAPHVAVDAGRQHGVRLYVKRVFILDDADALFAALAPLRARRGRLRGPAAEREPRAAPGLARREDDARRSSSRRSTS